MARVMDFPEELWDAEPEEWPRVLAEKRGAFGRGEAATSADLSETGGSRTGPGDCAPCT